MEYITKLIIIFGILLLNTSIGGIGIITFSMSDEKIKKISFYLLSFAAGILLGGAYIHLLPHASEMLGVEKASLLALGGFFLFFIFEQFMHWHRCKECALHPYSELVLMGDALHNFFDGLVVSLSFLSSAGLGIVSSIGILAHEVPQQLGIFGIMIHAGKSKRDSIVLPILVQSTSILGGVCGVLIGTKVMASVPIALGLAAGSFFYIAASDLIPEMHKSVGNRRVGCVLAVVLGIVFMYVIKYGLHG